MDNVEEKQGLTWAEKHGGTIFGMSAFALLGLIVAFSRICG